MTNGEFEAQIDRQLKKWRNWHYKNTALLIISLAAFFYLAETPTVDNIIRSVGGLGYLGAFLAGIFFVSVFTVAPAAVVLFHLSEQLSPIEVALLAGLGGLFGDYIIFRFLKDRVFTELRPLFFKFGRPYLKILFKSPHFSWTLPIFGAIIVASPFPDEVGIGLLSLSKVKQWQFFALVFVLNCTGIFLIVSAARLF